MKTLWADTYETYKLDNEPHRVRVIAVVSLCLLIGAFGSNYALAAFPAMSLAISVLAGFTFTSLFSSHSMTANDLPPSQNETDRLDKDTLPKLSENFRVRSKFFIILAIIDLILIVILSIDFSAGTLRSELKIYLGSITYGSYIIYAASGIADFVNFLASSLIFFLFFECLYTFYRLSETIMSILDIRRNYLNAHIKP